MLDWWFDIEGKICCTRFDERKSVPDITFDGDVKMRFDGVKLLRSGLTYAYTSNYGHRVFINDIKFRGERYVSLYIDRELVKEYNVRAERYKEKYYKHPEWYDAPKKFFFGLLLHSLLGALFLSVASTATLAFFSVYSHLSTAFVLTAVAFFSLWIAATSLGYFIYDHVHDKMEQYAIVSSIKRRSRKKRIRKRVRGKR